MSDHIADVMGAEAERDAARREVEELRAWQLAVAEGLGFVERPEGQCGYRVASAAFIVDLCKAAMRERDDYEEVEQWLLGELGRRSDEDGSMVEETLQSLVDRLATDYGEAKAELEELRGQVALVNGHVFQRDTEIARLRAENERLARERDKIAEGGFDSYRCAHCGLVALDMAEIATHTRECEKSPNRAEIARLRAENERLTRERDEREAGR